MAGKVWHCAPPSGDTHRAVLFGAKVGSCARVCFEYLGVLANRGRLGHMCAGLRWRHTNLHAASGRGAGTRSVHESGCCGSRLGRRGALGGACVGLAVLTELRRTAGAGTGSPRPEPRLHMGWRANLQVNGRDSAESDVKDIMELMPTCRRFVCDFIKTGLVRPRAPRHTPHTARTLPSPR